MLTVSQFAEKIGFSRQSVLNWIKEGRIKAIRMNREYRIPESEVERLFDEGSDLVSDDSDIGVDDDIILGD